MAAEDSYTARYRSNSIPASQLCKSQLFGNSQTTPQGSRRANATGSQAGFELAIDEIQFFVYALPFKFAALSQPVDLPNPEIFKIKYVLSDKVFLVLHWL